MKQVNQASTDHIPKREADYGNDFYEFKPYFYAAFSLACFHYKSHSEILFYSGILFALASATVFYLRYFSRNYR